ncbi:hypothetical protein T01_13003 [Trichinella spiralis]|uniref:Uncharacterized protein n=1 Tax=Trichinella spiralis TaxID=6334 RepID=A0A0V1BT41_TRISP|nr:hypothetical protein T01_13003 [Trichinella spiralis]
MQTTCLCKANFSTDFQRYQDANLVEIRQAANYTAKGHERVPGTDFFSKTCSQCVLQLMEAASFTSTSTGIVAWLRQISN